MKIVSVRPAEPARIEDVANVYAFGRKLFDEHSFDKAISAGSFILLWGIRLRWPTIASKVSFSLMAPCERRYTALRSLYAACRLLASWNVIR
ncbi:hypothetical protein [Paenibacillus xerothermodurans]|uniref:Uncharacterized protein n=1 Tax=Paenibacillus xerothermodurans TaxID=1977292 RepID=A0A2W1N3W5_PAEXE|nr:hypothetical protein [Paenibacillus xerothermodurans]PZE19037.1 hypothetical protein CBW46_020665 [Paenibacillus xerothermodurans]